MNKETKTISLEDYFKEVKNRTKLQKLYWSARSFWKYSICSFITQSPYNLYYTFQYLRIIYKYHHEWDYGALIEIMIFKLERMEKFFRSENSIVDDKYYTAEEISEVIKLLKGFDDPDKIEQMAKREGINILEAERQMFERAFELMKKQMRSWWD